MILLVVGVASLLVAAIGFARPRSPMGTLRYPAGIVGIILFYAVELAQKIIIPWYKEDNKV